MNLHLAVKKKWFDQIKAGTKILEYRLDNDYWRKRLINRDYDKLIITLGYPKKEDQERRIELEYYGYTMKTVVSEEWNNEPKRVFAIFLVGANKAQ